MEINEDQISPLIEKFKREIADTNLSGFLMENHFEGHYISRLATVLSIAALMEEQHPSFFECGASHHESGRISPSSGCIAHYLVVDRPAIPYRAFDIGFTPAALEYNLRGYQDRAGWRCRQQYLFADNRPFLQRVSACNISAEGLEECVKAASFPVIFSNDVFNDPRFSPRSHAFWQLPAFHVHSGNSRELVNRPELSVPYAESIPLREFMKDHVHPVEGFREEELIEEYQLAKFEPDTHLPRLKKWLSLSSDLLVTTLRTPGTITYVWDSRGLHNDSSMNFPTLPSTSH